MLVLNSPSWLLKSWKRKRSLWLLIICNDIHCMSDMIIRVQNLGSHVNFQPVYVKSRFINWIWRLQRPVNCLVASWSRNYNKTYQKHAIILIKRHRKFHKSVTRKELLEEESSAAIRYYSPNQLVWIGLWLTILTHNNKIPWMHRQAHARSYRPLTRPTWTFCRVQACCMQEWCCPMFTVICSACFVTQVDNSTLTAYTGIKAYPYHYLQFRPHSDLNSCFYCIRIVLYNKRFENPLAEHAWAHCLFSYGKPLSPIHPRSMISC